MKMNPLEVANMYEQRLYEQTQKMVQLQEEMTKLNEKNTYLQTKISELIAKAIKDKKT
jgi:hypothetical protein